LGFRVWIVGCDRPLEVRLDHPREIPEPKVDNRSGVSQLSRSISTPMVSQLLSETGVCFVKRAYRGTLLVRTHPASLGPPYGPGHSPTVGSWEVVVSYERGTPAGREAGLE